MAISDCEITAERMREAYFEKAEQTGTWSGLPVQDFYGPADAAGVDYQSAIGEPGQFPYTRGIHRDMFRGRFWTRREVCGIGTPEHTNSLMRYLIGEGIGGLNVITDIPHKMGIDLFQKDPHLLASKPPVNLLHASLLPEGCISCSNPLFKLKQFTFES